MYTSITKTELVIPCKLGHAIEIQFRMAVDKATTISSHSYLLWILYAFIS